MPTQSASAERRVCSVLFADLVGFTPLSESRDPEAVREILSQYFDTARTVITRYGGVVEKFIGDAVMAVWGAPAATEGDAERAVRAGLDLVAAVAALGAEVGADGLALRSGVVTGEVAVTLGAVGQGMVAGDAVNTAARVQTAAGAGQVWVDETTRRLAGAAIGFAAEGEHNLKGKAEPVPLFRATRVLAGAGGAQRVDGLEAPLVGRNAELRTLKELFHATVDRRSPRLVVTSGPAGVGKSRLGWEFEKYIDGLAEVMWWHRGRCLSYGDAVTYWAIAEMVRQRFGIAEEDPLDVASGKLADLLPKFVPDPAEQDYVGARLARLLGVGYRSASATSTSAPDPTLSREELFAGWRVFFERLADTGPVVLLIEDAHHADQALLDFLDHLVDWARNVAIYVLVFTRGELLEQHPGWGVGRNRSMLNLDLLDDRSVDELVNELVPGMPAQATAAITGQAQGNPLFAIETIRSLIDRDIVVPIEGQYRLVGDVADLDVPDSLHGLLAARLDSLDPEYRALVADAAVLGTTFPAEALVAVSGREPGEVQAGLGELVRRGVLEISADRLSPQQGSYLFAQSMLRQVAYDTLSRRDRKARHLAVAAHLEATFTTDEMAEVVARHYLDALAAVPDDPDTGDIRGRAIDALLRAGERASSSGAPGRAAEDFATAADLTAATANDGNEPAAARLWERAAHLAGTAGRMVDVRRYAETARDLYTTTGRERDAARAAVEIGYAVASLGRTSEARALYTAALEILRPDPDADTVTALRRLALLLDDIEGATELADEALALGQALDLPGGELADLFVSRAFSYQRLNRLEEAIAAYERAVKLAQRSGDSLQQARALLNLANMVTALDPASAAEAAREAYELSRRVGAGNFAPVALANLAVAQIMLGEWDAAEQSLERGLDDDGPEDEVMPTYLAILTALRGDLPAATAHAALPGFRASEDPQDRSCPLLADTLIAAADHRPADALRFARQILDYETALGLTIEYYFLAWPAATRAAFELGDHVAVRELVARLDAHPIGHLPPLLRAERTLARARLLAADGGRAADAGLADAVMQLRAVGSPYHLAWGLLDHAEHRNVTGTGEAAPLVDEAVAIAAQLRARPLAERAALLRTDARVAD